MLMVEGDYIATCGEAPHRIRVCVVADCDVMHHGCCRGVGPLREQPHIDPKTDGGGVHHPSKLPTADDAHGEGLLTSHARKRTCHYDGQPAPTAGARGLLRTKLAPVRERRRRRI